MPLHHATAISLCDKQDTNISHGRLGHTKGLSCNVMVLPLRASNSDLLQACIYRVSLLLT
jgi:hypothetical protein